MAEVIEPARAGTTASQKALASSRLFTIAWVLLLVLSVFPVLTSLADLATNLRVGLPADHLATFARRADMPWAAAQQSLASPARYVTLLEFGYAVHELVFGRYHPTIHRQSLIAAITLPILLPAQPPRFFARRQAGAG